MVQYKNEVGNRYGKLEVLYKSSERTPSTGCIKWVCRCDCGNVVIVDGHNLRSGRSRSCGCSNHRHFKNLFKGEKHEFI